MPKWHCSLFLGRRVNPNLIFCRGYDRDAANGCQGAVLCCPHDAIKRIGESQRETDTTGDVLWEEREIYALPLTLLMDVPLNSCGDVIINRVGFDTIDSCKRVEKSGVKHIDEEGDGEEYVEFPCSTKEFKRQKKSFSDKRNRYITSCNYDTPSGGFIAESVTFSGDVRIRVITWSEMGCDLLKNELKQILQSIQFQSLTSVTTKKLK